jgi:mannose/fructose/N-acetylgalactosamine-specific phosphotransferase system component IIC
MKNALIAGAVIGLIVCGGILSLLWFGVSGVLGVRGIDLMYVLWPSSVLLVVTWHSTITGVTITALAVAMNCLMYMTLALVVRASVRFVVRLS